MQFRNKTFGFISDKIPNKEEDKMKRTFMTLIVLAFLSLVVNNAAAEQDLLESVADGCRAEIESTAAR
jgi:hypothetical protein